MTASAPNHTWDLSETGLIERLKSCLDEGAHTKPKVAPTSSNHASAKTNSIHTPSDYDLNPTMEPLLPPGTKPTPAAVLVAVRWSCAPTILFTQRTTHLTHHAGQISFPGGKIDNTDHNATAAAIREAHEELAIPHANVKPLGFLDTYHTATGFMIAPLVAILERNTQPKPNPNEVARCFEVPLAHLMNPKNRQKHATKFQGKTRYYYALPYEQHYIWGATAGILVNMQERLFGI